MKKKTVSTTSIAEKLGLSQQTVSDVLNGRYKEKHISEKTAERVRAMAEKMNYRPNRLAHGLLSGKTRTIGLVLPNVAHYFWPTVTRAIEEYADRNGYNIMLCCSGNNPDRELERINLLLEHRVDGLIIASVRGDGGKDNSTAVADIVNKEKTPVVIVNDCIEGVESGCVLTDEFSGGKLATEHLIKLGYSRIAHISGPDTYYNTGCRIEGYKAALAAAGMNFDEKLLVYETGFLEEHGLRAMKRLLKLERPPDSVFVAGDIPAIGAWRAIEEKGLRVPDDISLVGYGDGLYRAMSMFEIPLTTVRQPTYQMGARAVEMLTDWIEGRRIGEKKVVLPVELIVRNSSKPRD